MPTPARIDEADPFGDAGRLRSIYMTCAIAGQPRRAMALYESGLSDAETLALLAHEARLHPRDHAPFPGLLHDPFPGRDD